MRRLSRDPSVRSLSSRPNPTTQHLYFCHHRNGVYMGQVQNFQRHGLGLTLHDNGTTLLSSCYHDMLHGYNVAFFASGATMSSKYFKDRLEQVLYKDSEFMFYVKYSKGTPDGGAVLVKFMDQKIEYANYRGGDIIAKAREDDSVILNRVFVQKKYSDILPREHLANVELQGLMHDEIIVSKRAGKVLVGFSKDQFLLNGLGFILLLKPAGSGGKSQHVEVLERGYYKSSQLSGFGHRSFKNGNFYSGEFRYDQFEGTGVLRNIHKHNWVSGNFQKGTLVRLVQYGNQGDEKAANKAIQQIHERKTTWVDKELVVPSKEAIQKEILMVGMFCDDQRERVLENKRSDVLRRIQDNFITSGIEEWDAQNGQESSDSRRHQVPSERRDSPREGRASTNHENMSYSLIHQSPQGIQSSSSQRRNRIFDQSPRLESSPGLYKSSFRLQVSPVPIQVSKQIESRLQIRDLYSKGSQLSVTNKTPERVPKSSLRSGTNQSKSVGKKATTPSTHTIKLIDSMYKKNQKAKLF